MRELISSAAKQAEEYEEEKNLSESREELVTEDAHALHYYETMMQLERIKLSVASAPKPSELRRLAVSLPPTDRKTIVFDLDETLIHSVDDPNQESHDALLMI